MRKRLPYVDLYKGIGILLMIAGHTGYIGIVDKAISRIGFSLTVDQWVHAFHMPMFFIISGYLFPPKYKEIDLWEFFEKKIRTLLVPYLVFGMFHYIISILLNYSSVKSLYDKDGLYSLLFMNSNGIPIAGALWFLTALFFAETIFAVLCKCIGNKYLRIGFIVTIAFVGSIWTQVTTIRLPWSLDSAFVGVGLLAVGFSFRHFIEGKILSTKLWLISIIGLIIGTIICSFNTTNMRKGQYGNIFLFWISSIILSLALLFFVKEVFIRNERKTSMQQNRINRILGHVSCSIEKIGEYSIIYLCFNQIVIRQVKLLLPSLDIPWLWIVRLLYLILTVAILFCVRVIFVNTRLRYIIGKGK